MIDCAAMSDRMPDVAHGTAKWTDAEDAHLVQCAACAEEWQIIKRGAALHSDLTLSSDRIAQTVTARLRAEPAIAPAIRRIPWRGGMIGLVAAAASVVLILSAPRLQLQQPRDPGDAAESAIVSMLPELQQLNDSELEVVLQSLGPTAADATPGVLPHLEDLTDSELEQLLHAKGEE